MGRSGYEHSTLDLMLSPTWEFADGTPRICHGFFYTPIKDGLYGHGGNTEGCSADLQLDLKNKTGYVMLINLQSERIYSTGLSELLFGKQNLPTESGFEKVDLAGHYKMGRSCGGAGMMRIASVFEDDFKVSPQGDSFTGSRGVAKMTQISDAFVEAELINGVKHYYGIKKDANGDLAALESFQAIDYVKQSDVQYITDITMIVLFITSIAVMAVLFVIHAARLKKFKGQPEEQFKRSEKTAALAGFIIFIELVLIGLNLYLFLYSGIVVHSIAAVLLCALAFVEAVMLVRCYFCSEKPQNKILLYAETLCSVFTIVGIVYWTLYQSWGF